MIKRIDLEGEWEFRLDGEKKGIDRGFFLGSFEDTIKLPSTTAIEKKGEPNPLRETGFLTEEYKFEGFAWYSRKFFVPEDMKNRTARLILERTRKTAVWINGKPVGSENSLNAPHIYDITLLLKSGENTVTVLVDNTDYPTRGGHLTSPDTQTNWNGITGRIAVEFYDSVYIEDIQIYTDVKNKKARVSFILRGADSAVVSAQAEAEGDICSVQSFGIKPDNTGRAEFVYDMGEEPLLWSEYTPCIYTMKITVDGSADMQTVSFGMRDFSADGMEFKINGHPVFLRGKHDGLVFPLTGAAPADVESWIGVFKTAKEYGINHYRFHTCCPPEAAFTAADMLGIYMEPELPFWGTIAAKDDEGYNEEEQQYLINEGFRIMQSFGNHPSFCMFSLGNELWGSPERINEIMGYFKAYDQRHLYTMGSNNFQFFPNIVENDDFFCGVRLSRDRLIRGSYAMCDAPLGHIQTDEPGTMHSYDRFINDSAESGSVNADGEIEIQYGTGVKKVKVSESSGGLSPKIPVVSHEVGQYAVYPDFSEIEKYTGVLKARNFEIFRKRLEDAQLGGLAHEYFLASGKLSAACYKDEIETAMRSGYLSGFQLLDLQDFPGQGTALVGMLNAFMESKGLISPEDWRKFCSDSVILGQFERYVYSAGERFTAYVSVRDYTPAGFSADKAQWSFEYGGEKISGEFAVSAKGNGLLNIGVIEFEIPETAKPCKAVFKIRAGETENSYDLWIYPETDFVFADMYEKNGNRLFTVHSAEKAAELLEKGERVLLIPDEVISGVDGIYCTDFWCYPMFRSISESMNKPVPAGTMGLLIDTGHKALESYPSEFYSTPQWYNIAMGGRCAVLDGTGISPIVRTIDNFERNHSLGILFEANVSGGKLMVCTSGIETLSEHPEIKQFAKSVTDYCLSDEFCPESELSDEKLKEIFG
ncbi:MAG: sugar-binding domain-containing protein [Porcipelethomonas sp.]